MQPLGSAALLKAYHDRLTSPHDYDITVEVLTMNERVLSPAVLVDGQINLQRDADIRRTATLTLLDPDTSLGLDTGSPLQGALFADRLIRIRHHVEVDGYGVVSCTPFVGPISRLNRNGATIDLEVQDKTALAILGAPSFTVRKGDNAVAAIRSILATCTGEFRFRFPAGNRARLGRNYSVSWPDEASPWAVASRIARSIGLKLFYSCDGYATLRPVATSAVFEFGDRNLTSAVSGDSDFSNVINHARASYGDFVKTATAPSDHPLSPQRLARNGVPRYLPSLADVDAPNKPERPGGKRRKASKAQLKKYAVEMEKYEDQLASSASKAQAVADATLKSGLPLELNLAWSAVPAFHLDVDDPVRVTTPEGSTNLPFSEASIPLVSGDMSVGLLKKVSRPGRLR